MTTSNSVHLQQRVIGLTGGIGMGKTTVSDYLATVHHIPVLDADIFAREAVQPGAVALAELVDRYGSGVLLPDGSLNRHRLGDIIFSSPAERLWVEQRIHPYVRDRLTEAMQTPLLRTSPIVLMVIPLLFEARMTDLVTETWVIRCTEDQQLQRLIQRDHLSFEQAQARMNSQMAIQKKLARADLVLDNTSTPDQLYQQIDRYLAEHPQQVTIRRGC
ncbi:MAG TPA: dephospho-CoA kinase [Microcoleaceae cyanobacterium]|jgi:dephospho-CoA kinase